MKSFTPFSLCLFVLSLLNFSVYGVPVVSKRQEQSLVIHAPTKDDTWVIGSTKAIIWESTGNSPIDILLSKEASSEVIVLAQGLNSFQESYVLTVPTSIKSTDPSNDSKWKVIIKNDGQIFSNSDYFSVSEQAPSMPVESVPPPSEALSANPWAATASISLLGPDGKALSLPQTAASSAYRASFVSLWTLLASVITTCLFISL